MRKIFVCAVYTLLIKVASGQNIGIGTAAPHASAVLDLTSGSKGLLIPRVTSSQRTAIASPGNGLQVYDINMHRLYQYQNGEWKQMITNDYWNMNGSDIFNTGLNVGINTTNPTEAFHVVGNIRSVGNINSTGDLNMDGSVSANGLLSTGNMVVNGTGIFTSDLTSQSSMIINDAAGILQFKNNSDNKVFVQLSGDNLRIGTNSGNTAGELIFRMNGTDLISLQNSSNSARLMLNSGGVHTGTIQTFSSGVMHIRTETAGTNVTINNELYVNETQNRVGIGTATPDEKLDVQGNAQVLGDIILAGRVVKYSNPSVALTPLCFGRIGSDGTILSGSGNYTVQHIGEGNFRIHHSEISVSTTVVATVATSNGQIIVTAGCSVGFASVYMRDAFGGFASIDQPFSFIIYK